MSDPAARFGWRGWLVALVFAAAGIALAGRALWLQVIDKEFLLSQGDARHLRVVPVPAHRGTITDRNGEVLAVSTPVESISCNPRELLAQPTRIVALAKALEMQPGALRKHLADKAGREFVYLKRHLSPEQAAKVLALKVPGVYSQREYRRYYPAGEVTSQALGLANIDDVGQEGVELALQEQDCMQLRDYLQRIAMGVDRASHLTYQLLQLARAEASHEKAAQKMEPLDLGELAREVSMRCAPRALARNIDIGFEEADIPMKIFGVPLLLREMIDNLVDNAIKYTPAGGAVTVRLRIDSGWILEVEDTGIGISPTDRERVFDRFYRVLGTDADGSGLGLAIVREIAELHEASIEVLQNPQGRGTLFRIVFTNSHSK